MRGVNRLCLILMWGLLSLFTITNIGASIAIEFVYNSKFNGLALVVPPVIMLVSAILYCCLPKRRAVWVILCAAAGIIMLLVSLELERAFPVHIDASGKDVGMTTWTLIWRHSGIVVVPVLMLCAWMTGRAADAADRKWCDNHDHTGSRYDLSGSTIFKDDSDIGDALRDEPASPKLKRSVRKRLEKAGHAEQAVQCENNRDKDK